MEDTWEKSTSATFFHPDAGVHYRGWLWAVPQYSKHSDY